MRVVVLASGTGSNFVALAEHFQVTSLVCDRPDAKVLERARERGILTHVVPRLKGEDRQAHEARLLAAIAKEDFDLVCLAGWRRLCSPFFLSRFAPGSVINIHPSLLPAHAGLGGYEKAFHANDATHGVTVHYVDEGMDTGEIIAQRTYQRAANATLDTFTQAGLALEHSLYPTVVRSLSTKEHFYRVEVLPRASALLVGQTLRGRVYWIKSVGPMAQLKRLAQEVLSDPIAESVFIGGGAEYSAHLESLGFVCECWETGFLPGVTDNAGMSATAAFEWHPATRGRGIQVRTGETTRPCAGAANPLLHWQVHRLEVASPVWEDVRSAPRPARTLDLSVDDTELVRMNKDNWWALTLPELRVVREFFAGLGRGPTDVEMEVIAQTWSEHCKHKIFRAKIRHQDERGVREIDSLFKTFIKGATDEVVRRRGIDWLKSVFHDNAGVVRWDAHLDVAVKVETHNSPSALDPYGGALTGILGVNRDILGVGLGARPVANTDVFCLAPEGLKEHMGERWPAEIKSPEVIRAGVHAGVRDGGNKSGIPTVNGAFQYDVSYAGKPLVYCGTVGVMPHKVGERDSFDKSLRAGDRVVMAGGRVGKDGLHGATFSSLEWQEGTPASVVQIGDPLTQKRLMDFILEARDAGLYHALTDNGAGGLSSSVGEMAQLSGGVEIELAAVPLKYPGLSAWEILVSESQERMTLAVAPECWPALSALAQARGVEVTDLGQFTNDGVFRATHHGVEVAALPLAFLHEGLPAMELMSRWHRRTWHDWCEGPVLRKDYPGLKPALLAVLASANVRSHENMVRQYDHEVQAATMQKPFAPDGRPSDAGVVMLAPHGGEERHALAISSGLAPQLSRFDTRLMAMHAVDEAVRNAVCAGADPERLCLLDNFCWPDPLAPGVDGEEKLAQLVRACEGLYDSCVAYGMPLVSGKDSMKNDAHLKTTDGGVQRISVLPTLLVTAVGLVPDVGTSPPSAPGKTGLTVGWLPPLGRTVPATLGTLFKTIEEAPEEVDPERPIARYRAFHRAIRTRLIHSAHDVSEGGLIAALGETAGAEVGWSIDWDEGERDLFGEGVGMILFTTPDWEGVLRLLPEARRLGVTTPGGGLQLNDIHWSTDELRSAHQGMAFREEA